MDDAMRYPDSCDCVNEVEEARCENIPATGQYIYTRVSAYMYMYLSCAFTGYDISLNAYVA